MKITIIGTGNMGGAIARGILSDESIELTLYDTDSEKTQPFQESKARIAPSVQEAFVDSHIIILALKPAALTPFLKEHREDITTQCLLSVAAGVPIAAITAAVGRAVPVIRAMPNTPALVGEGVTALCANDEAMAMREKAETLFSRIGTVELVPENLMDAVTGLSGSGPAFVFTFIQALTDGAVRMGIPRHQALRMAAQTVKGAAELQIQEDMDPHVLRGRVTSPGGTTIEGIHQLEKAGFSGTVMDAVGAAANKSSELGKRK